ncbi:MAG: MFS transporter [Dermatophilus congolensis]|nr:MFS transporter [Dermatophilus congolensis]
MTGTDLGRPPRLWPLYIGGFLGPFGGAMVNAIFPEIARGLNTDVSTAAWAMTVYMVPFAGFMVVSGTLANSWGRARTLRIAYVGYAAACLVCALASTVPLFMLGRALSGLANAFTTPLLIAMISDLVPPNRIGRSIGTYASMQAAGQAFAPLVGGAAATWDYRLAFGASALVALGLVFVTPTPQEETTRSNSRAAWAALANRKLARAAGTALTAQFAGTAILILSAMIAADRFDLAPGPRGALVALFGVAGLLSGRIFGAVSDRIGLVRAGCGALATVALVGALLGVAPSIVALGLLISVGGAASTGTRVLTNTLAVQSTPTNKGGATSITLAAQFTGTACVPALLPLYATSPATATAVAGIAGLVGIGIVTLTGR